MPKKPTKARIPAKRKKKKVSKIEANPSLETRARGRPTAYKTEYADSVRKLHLLGATDEEVAEFFNVTVQTLYNWRKKHTDFFEAEVGAKVFADAEVAASAHKRATGYSYETEKLVGKGADRKTVKVTVHVPSDPTAAQWWLRNRRRGQWGDTKQLEVGKPGDFDGMSEDQIREFISITREMIDLEEGNHPG